MKICHLADTHLGGGAAHSRRATSGLTERQEDIIRSFVEVIDKIIAIKPDVVIHAGDIFDSVRPLNRLIAVAAEQLHRLAAVNKIPTVIISGNHDAPKQPHIGAALDIFRHIENLHIACKSELEIFKIGPASLFALPHCLTTDILKAELSRCKPEPKSEYNMLILHGVAAGMPEFSMADLGEQELPLETMAEFDYTALGHYHNCCQVGPRAWYAGSSERLSQSERESEKGFLEVDLGPLEVRFHPVKTRPMLDLAVIDASEKRGDELVEIIRQKVEAAGAADKIVRLKIKEVSEETLKTMPVSILSDLKQKAFSLNISFERSKGEEELPAFGRAGIGNLDVGFVEFIESVDLTGFDRERIKREALKYLASDN